MHAVPHGDRLSLDGAWRFQLLHAPDETAGEAWGEAEVPGCWTMQDTWDRPIYTNVQMPFPNRPPEVPEENPTGVYERTFSLPAAWAGRRVVLHVGAAESVLIVELDGVEVGVSKDSHLAAEFDLTDRLARGRAHPAPDGREVVGRHVHRGPGPVVARRASPGPCSCTRPGTCTSRTCRSTPGWSRQRHRAPSRSRLPWAGGRSSERPGWQIEATLEGLAGPLAAAVADQPPPPGGPGDWAVPGPPRRGVLDLVSLSAAGALTARDDVARWEQARPVVRPPRVGIVRLEARVPGVTPWSAEVPALHRLEVVLRGARRLGGGASRAAGGLPARRGPRTRSCWSTAAPS